MVESDVVRFAEAFNLLATTFKLWGTARDKEQTRHAYFKALKPYPIEAVERAAQQLVASHPAQKFPLPVDWLAKIPRELGVHAPSTLRILTDREAHEQREAFAVRCEGDPCSCRACTEAAVSTYPLRYVPESDVPVWDPFRRERTLPGHWIHGAALARWYAARNEFFQKAPPSIRSTVVDADDDPLRGAPDAA